MQWPEGQPELAHFVCSKNGCVIEHSSKRDMVERGEWRAASPFNGHASFHIWAAYSYSPNAAWGQLATEFVRAKKQGPLKLRVFINTVLGESWSESGEAPDWQRLYQRREHYLSLRRIPEGVKFLTAGVDVQKDRWVYEVVGWGAGKSPGRSTTA
jgi:phage terminase large subunit GpA-like protein